MPTLVANKMISHNNSAFQDTWICLNLLKKSSTCEAHITKEFLSPRAPNVPGNGARLPRPVHVRYHDLHSGDSWALSDCEGPRYGSALFSSFSFSFFFSSSLSVYDLHSRSIYDLFTTCFFSLSFFFSSFFVYDLQLWSVYDPFLIPVFPFLFIFLVFLLYLFLFFLYMIFLQPLFAPAKAQIST